MADLGDHEALGVEARRDGRQPCRRPRDHAVADEEGREREQLPVHDADQDRSRDGGPADDEARTCPPDSTTLVKGPTDG